MNSTKILTVENLSKTYHSIDAETIAIDNISFDLFENEFISIIGPSGCGKSSILNIISNIDKTFKGNIKYNKNIKFGYMLQNDALFEWLTILDNALLGLKINKDLTEENKKYVIDLLFKYGLKDFIDKYPSSLSGGMKQRVVCI